VIDARWSGETKRALPRFDRVAAGDHARP